MGLGFVLLVWAVFAVVLGLVGVASYAIFLYGKSKGSKVLTWLGGVSLTVSSFIGVIFVLFMVCAFIYNGFLILRKILQEL